MRSFVKFLFGLDRLLGKLETALMSVALLALLFVSAINVILRSHFFNSGITWAPDVSQHLVLWITLFGASLATQEGRHLNIDALQKVFPKRVLPLVQILVTCFCIFICVLLTIYSYDYLMIEKKYDTMILLLKLPVWKAIIIMPIGFTMITFRFVVQLFEQLVQFSGVKISRLDKKGEGGLDISVNIQVK